MINLRTRKLYAIAKIKFRNYLGIFMPKEKFRKIVGDYTIKPRMLNLEVTNICNARCIFSAIQN